MAIVLQVKPESASFNSNWSFFFLILFVFIFSPWSHWGIHIFYLVERESWSSQYLGSAAKKKKNVSNYRKKTKEACSSFTKQHAICVHFFHEKRQVKYTLYKQSLQGKDKSGRWDKLAGQSELESLDDQKWNKDLNIN